jgi:hypothetical protein
MEWRLVIVILTGSMKSSALRILGTSVSQEAAFLKIKQHRTFNIIRGHCVIYKGFIAYMCYLYTYFLILIQPLTFSVIDLYYSLNCFLSLVRLLRDVAKMRPCL